MLVANTHSSIEDLSLHEFYFKLSPTKTDPFIPVVGDTSDAEEGKYLVSMPTKFRKSVWIKRGDFVIVEPIEEGDKVKAEIVRFAHLKYLRYLSSINMKVS